VTPMTRRRVVVHTDLFLEHLAGTRTPSVLRVAARTFFCYTTVFNAIELFAGARGARERTAMRHAMGAVKVLGLNARSAVRSGALFRKHPKADPLLLLVAGLCIESGLPLLTNRPAASIRCAWTVL